MRLPFLQLESDLLAHGAAEMAHLAGCSPAEIIGHLALLRAWAVSHATDEAPPDGWVNGDAAGRRIEAAAQWRGERGALLRALVDAGQVSAEQSGMRVLHLEPYVKAWDQNAKAKERMRIAREEAAKRRANEAERSANNGAMRDERSAKFNGQTQTQTQTQTQKESQEKPLAAGAAPPVQGALLEAPSASQPSRAPPKPKPPAEPKGDPRHQPLVDELCAEAPDYTFRGPADGAAVKRLLALADAKPETRGDAAPAEILRRWRICRKWVGFPTSRHLGDFAENWSAYVREQAQQGPPPKPLDVRKGNVPAEAFNHDTVGPVDI